MLRAALSVRRAAASFAALAALFTSAPAIAAEPGGATNNWATRPLAVEAHLGFGTPFGFGGVAVEWTPVPFFSLSGGAGITSLQSSQNAAVHGAVHARFRLPLGRPDALSVAAGASGGPFEWTQQRLFSAIYDPDVVRWDFALFANADLAYEHRFDGGVQLRTYIGYGLLLNRGAGACAKEQSTCPSFDRSLFAASASNPYVGVSVGYAFAL